MPSPPSRVTRLLVVATASCGGLGLAGCTPENAQFASARQMESLSDGIGGPKAMARPGDFVMENDRVRIAILGDRFSMGSGLFGGSVIDADLQRYDPAYAHGEGNDLFSEMFATANMNVMALAPPDSDEAEKYGASSIEIVNDGSDGEAAVVRVTAPAAPFLTMLDLLWAIVNAPDIQMVTDYVLEPGEPGLRMRTTVTVGDGEPATDGEMLDPATEDMPLLDYAIETGLVLGDFYLAGGTVDVFTPGIGFDESGAVNDAYEADRNLFTDPFVVDFIANTGDGTSYGIAPLEGIFQIPMFTSDQTAAVGAGIEGESEGPRFEDGTAFTYERIFVVGEGDVGSVLDGVLEMQDAPRGRVEGHVLERGTQVPLTDVHVFAYEGSGDDRASLPYSEWRTDVGRDTREDGSFGGSLPPGTWTLLAHAKGRPEGESVVVELEDGESLTVGLELPMTGQVETNVVDEAGREVPAKVSFFSTSGGTTRDPDLGDGYISGAPTEVVFTAGGPVDAVLPPGEYYAVASRGPEYELGVSEPFTTSDHDLVKIELQVVRSVDTTGFISADLHVHCGTSFDSGVSLQDRVVSMASEGVEFFSATDHDYHTDYDPVVEDLGMEQWVRTTVGVETSTVELGHFLGFPVQVDHLAEAGGAFDWTGMDPDDMFDAIRELGRAGGAEPVVTAAHPRDGILGYFDQYGLSAYESDGGDVKVSPDTLTIKNDLIEADAFSMEFDAMEVFNAKRFELIRTPTQPELDAWAEDESSTSAYAFITRDLEEQQALVDGTYTLGYGVLGHVDDWFNFLNLGYRITALGNSDTHSMTKIEAGCPRNYVLADTDDPAYLDPDAIADAVRNHRVVASYGPFVRFEADGEPVGSEISADGAVELFVEVQSPLWFDVDRVELYENGTLIHEWTIQTPNAEVLNLSETWTAEPEGDAWYVVVAAGDDDLAPLCTPVERPHVQLQDVVVEALANVDAVSAMLSEAVPRPRTFPVYPYAITNPIWVDQGGDGWTAPGLASWLVEPEEPEEEGDPGSDTGDTGSPPDTDDPTDTGADTGAGGGDTAQETASSR